MRAGAALAAAMLLGVGIARRATAQQGAAVYLTPGDSAAHVYRSDRSGFADATRLVVRDAQTWRRVWATLAVGTQDTASPPPVDFRREMVIVAAVGGRPSAGYAVAVDTVRRAGFALEAVVRTAEPGPGCAGGAAFIEPTDAVRVPRSERPVFFTERREAVACDAPRR